MSSHGPIPDRKRRKAVARAYERARVVGTVSWSQADRLAVELAGVHPSQV